MRRSGPLLGAIAFLAGMFRFSSPPGAVLSIIVPLLVPLFYPLGCSADARVVSVVMGGVHLLYYPQINGS